ncbi:MAG: N-acetylmuramoyl-L-alanine amidase [Chloroflexaceae bacterium]|jgi:N-acetyl-anhydromuramyl-L-alanine amidase AmpD|nr:N-acetylmuramoyl-L-alanine amidase [Chloroflexaceae bacterium]
MPRREQDGWCPFAEHAPSTRYWLGNRGRRAVVLHSAEGSYRGTIAWLQNGSVQVSAHFVVSRSGQIAQLISTDDSAWANGLAWQNGGWVNARGVAVRPRWPGLTPGVNPNWQTISIEHEGSHRDPWPEAMRNATLRLLRWLGVRHSLRYSGGQTLIGHGDLDPLDRPNCPGHHVDFDRLAEAANDPTTGVAQGVQQESPICGPASGELEPTVRYVERQLGPTSEYRRDVATIMGYYWQHAPAVGVDPFLAAVQCVHETGSLQSQWAARPRRNPAGLGVHDEGGLSFPSWEVAVQAHLGQLLAFALSDEAATPAQRVMMERNPRFGRISPSMRGSVQQLGDLSGRWAPDPEYAAKMVARSQAILQAF